MTDITPEALEALQKACGTPHLPTELTHNLRIAIGGEGPRAYDWSDKPHRLVYDACRRIEELEHQIRTGQLIPAPSVDDAALVERVARAIVMANTEQRLRAASDMSEEQKRDAIECQVHGAWDLWTGEATAAISAMQVKS